MNASVGPAPRREYFTICDRGFLLKALVLHRSLLRHAGDFHLTVFCLDDESERILDELAPPKLSTVPIAELEAFDPELAETKADRKLAEYSWTAKPPAFRYLFERRPGADVVSYLDADHMFFGDPKPLFDELGDDAVLITPHRYSPEYAGAIIAGVYNAGFIAFRRDPRALEVLDDWRGLVIEWCYHRHEPTRSGDQKYLDYWPDRFDGIHVLEHLGGGVAPWNVDQYRLERSGDGVLVDGVPLIFVHYHRVELRREGRHEPRPGGYHLSRRVQRLIYAPYLAEIDRALADVREVAPGFDAGLQPRPPWRERLAKGADEARIALLAHAGPLRRLKRRLSPAAD